MGKWIAFYDAYRDKTAEKEAFLPLEKTGARILLIAGGADEAWPAEYSVNEIRTYLENKHYEKEVSAGQKAFQVRAQRYTGGGIGA